MTTTADQILMDQNLTCNYSTSGVVFSASQTFYMYPKLDGVPLQISLGNIFTTYLISGLPIGDSFQVGGNAELCYLTNIDISVVPDTKGLIWKVVHTYTGNVAAVDNANFLAYSANVSGQFVDTWRDVAPPAGGTPNNTDIGGTALDSGGVPVSKFVTQSSVQTTRRTTAVNWNGIFAAVGKRNSDAYDGAAVGQLLFTGIGVSTVAQGVYEVSYQYLSDSLYHCRQLVIVEDGDGRPMTTNSQAKDVRWVQPYTTSISFTDLFV